MQKLFSFAVENYCISFFLHILHPLHSQTCRDTSAILDGDVKMKSLYGKTKNPSSSGGLLPLSVYGDVPGVMIRSKSTRTGAGRRQLMSFNFPPRSLQVHMMQRACGLMELLAVVVVKYAMPEKLTHMLAHFRTRGDSKLSRQNLKIL